MENIINSIAVQFNQGGPFMWVILIVLALVFAISLERFIYYFFIVRVNSRKLVSDVISYINSDNKDSAMLLANKKSYSPLVKLVSNATELYYDNYSYEEIEEALEEDSIKEIPKYSNRLNYLALFANIATLLGLLGTIAGLQVSFSSLADVDASQKATLLASGISQAMNTTAFGLIVAIPSMAFYTMLTNKKNSMLKDLDEAMVKYLNFLKRKIADK